MPPIHSPLLSPGSGDGSLRGPAAAGSREEGAGPGNLGPAVHTWDIRPPARWAHVWPLSSWRPPHQSTQRPASPTARPPSGPPARPRPQAGQPETGSFRRRGKARTGKVSVRSSLRDTPCFRDKGQEALTGSYLRAEHLARSACGHSSRVPGSATLGRPLWTGVPGPAWGVILGRLGHQPPRPMVRLS